jgi:hypothetical protein
MPSNDRPGLSWAPRHAGAEGRMSAAGIGLLIIAHVADYTTFVVMVARHGLHTELNPIVATLAEDWGLPLLTVAKFATVLFVAATFLVLGRSRPRLAGAVLAFGIFVGGVGTFSNLVTM